MAKLLNCCGEAEQLLFCIHYATLLTSFILFDAIPPLCSLCFQKRSPQSTHRKILMDLV